MVAPGTQGAVHNFRKLAVWQRSHRLSVDLIRGTAGFSGPGRFALGGQVAKTAISVPSNIAEGAGRHSAREFRRFLTIALGSAYELEAQLLIAQDLHTIDDAAASRFLHELGEIQRMLHGLRASPHLRNPFRPVSCLPSCVSRLSRASARQKGRALADSGSVRAVLGPMRIRADGGPGSHLLASTPVTGRGRERPIGWSGMVRVHGRDGGGSLRPRRAEHPPLCPPKYGALNGWEQLV